MPVRLNVPFPVLNVPAVMLRLFPLFTLLVPVFDAVNVPPAILIPVPVPPLFARLASMVQF